MMKQVFYLLMVFFCVWHSSQAQKGTSIKIKGTKVLFNEVRFSPTQDKILIGSTGNWAKIWDLKSNKIIAYKHPSGVNAVTFSPDGLTFATGSGDNNAYLWNVNRRNVIPDTFAHQGSKIDFTSLKEYGVGAVAFSPDGKTLVTGSDNGFLKYWDIEGKNLLKKQSLGEGIKHIRFHPDGTTTVLGIFGEHNFLNFPGKTNKYTDLVYSPDSTFAVMSFRPHVSMHDFTNINQPQKHDPGSSAIYHFNSKKLIELDAGDPSALALSSDNKYVAVGERNGKISLYNLKGQLLYAIEAHHGDILSISFSRDSKRFVTTGEDGIIKLWNVGERLYLAELHPSGTTDQSFTIALPSGYYFNSGRQVDGIIINGASYSFNDADVRFHRPDIVMKALGYADSNKISTYQKVYEKRMSTLQLDERVANTTSSRPVIEIDRSEIPRFSVNKEVTFTVKAQSETEELANILVSVNGVPLHGSEGLPLAGKSAEKEITFNLSNGKNSVVSEVITQSGRTSLRKEFLVVRESDKKLPDLYIIGIGSGKFGAREDRPQELSTANDINQVVNAYQTRSGDLFKKIHTKVLMDDQVTVENILQLKSWLNDVDVDDLVIFFYTGHGFIDKENQVYYLSTYGIQQGNLSEKGLNYDEVEKLLDGIPSRKKLIMLNACHSGEYDEDITTFELMKKTFVDLRTHSGAYVISSSTSYSSSFAQQSNASADAVTVFTEGLLSVFKDSATNGESIMAGDLKELLYDAIEEQTPTLRRENTSLNFRIW